MSRPLVFSLVPKDWTDVWEAVDSLRLAVDELASPDRERAFAAVQACMKELRPLWEAHAEELTDRDPRLAWERVTASTCIDDNAFVTGSRWIGTDLGALIVRYADSDATEEPLWLCSGAELLRSLLTNLQEVVE